MLFSSQVVPQDPGEERALLKEFFPLLKNRGDALEKAWGKALFSSAWSEGGKQEFTRLKYQELAFGSLCPPAKEWPPSLLLEEERGFLEYLLHSGNSAPSFRTFFLQGTPIWVETLLPSFLEGIKEHRFSFLEMKDLLSVLKKRGLLSEEASFVFFSSPEASTMEEEEEEGVGDLFVEKATGDYPGLGLPELCFALIDGRGLPKSSALRFSETSKGSMSKPPPITKAFWPGNSSADASMTRAKDLLSP